MRRRCEYCFKQILLRKGAYTKHLCYCSLQQASPKYKDKNDSMPLNPLLSLHCDEAHLTDSEYYLDGFKIPTVTTLTNHPPMMKLLITATLLIVQPLILWSKSS